MNVRYSAIKTFLSCKRYYYYNFVLNIDSPKFNRNFLIGEIVGFGIAEFYSENEDYIQDSLNALEKRKEEIREKYITVDEEDLIKITIVVQAILEAYYYAYAQYRDTYTSVKAEYEIKYELSKDITIVGHIDSLLLYKGKLLVLHEFKTTKSITASYVKGICNDIQTALYFHAFNRAYKNKIGLIIYDCVQKPGIKQKKDETKIGYLDRLAHVYMEKPESFYMDIRTEPMITDKRIFNMVKRVTDYMLNGEGPDYFYPNDSHCYTYGQCQYYNMCHEDKQ